MKKFMLIIALLSLVIMPSVHAITITDCAAGNKCFVYTAGNEVNFYKNDEEANSGSTNAGLGTIILSDDGASSQYVRALPAMPQWDSTWLYYDSSLPEQPGEFAKQELVKWLDASLDYTLQSVQKDSNDKIEVDFISLEELEKVFGATKKDDGTYEIDVAKWGETFKKFYAIGSRGVKGFFTGSYETDDDGKPSTVWVVEYTYDTTNVDEYINAPIKSIIVKQEPIDKNNDFAYVPVMNFNKTYDCTVHGDSAEEMACYSCDNDYKWLKVGEQASTCTLVPNVTSVASCVKPVKTGVEDYLVEFGAVLLIASGALVIIKRKDLFKSI